MLGAIDDILHYYSAFKKMNLKPSSQGLKINLILKMLNGSIMIIFILSIELKIENSILVGYPEL